MKITKQLLDESKRAEKPTKDQELGFGTRFTDHMAIVDYSPEKGWYNARIVPLDDFKIHPASPVLHYGQEIFEGQKAYRREDGEILLFRPEENAMRMNRSANRMSMPEIDIDLQVELTKQFVDVERDWVPRRDGSSLYLRPTMIARGKSLGASTAKEFTYFIIASPSGSYYKDGIKPVKIMIEDKYVRAVIGGTGAAKTGGNYASSFKATANAQSKGYAQVLWLDGKENKYVEEVGAMNMMFVIDGKIITPNLSGSILPGITRKSVIELAKTLDIEVEERQISLDELFEKHESGKLTEAFGTGTAAVISPVGLFTYKDKTISINNEEIGPVASRIYKELTDIQWGRKKEDKGWSVTV